MDTNNNNNNASSLEEDPNPALLKPPPPPLPAPPQIPKVKPKFVDIHEHFDYSLLKRFYDELMIPNFPMEDGIYLSKTLNSNTSLV